MGIEYQINQWTDNLQDFCNFAIFNDLEYFSKIPTILNFSIWIDFCYTWKLPFEVSSSWAISSPDNSYPMFFRRLISSLTHFYPAHMCLFLGNFLSERFFSGHFFLGHLFLWSFLPQTVLLRRLENFSGEEMSRE
jgi:hypothetical protein